MSQVPPPVIDLARGVAACADSTDLHRQMAQMLAADMPARLATIGSALASGSWPAAAALAHKNKGACLAVGAIALANLFTSIDQACRGNDGVQARILAEGLAAASEAFRTAAAGL